MPCPEPRGEAMSRRVGTGGRAAKKLPRESAKLRRRRNAGVRSALSAAGCGVLQEAQVPDATDCDQERCQLGTWSKQRISQFLGTFSLAHGS
jgi:hypothetical protein